MDITRHVETLQRQLVAAAAAGGEQVQETANRLATALEAAGRLVILEALTEAMAEITRDLAPGAVDVRLRGQGVDFVVVRPPQEEQPATTNLASPSASEPDDASPSRVTLRLSEGLKTRAEHAAATDGISLNTWLVRAVATALEPTGRAAQPARGSSYTGWVR